MFQAKALSLALLVATAASSPLPNAPTKVTRRDLPKPSSYPLGDACSHEWQYLNFNKDDPTDKAHLEKLHDVICSGEMRALSSYGAGSAERNLAPYKRFFPPSDDEDDYQKHVSGVLNLITGTSSSDGAIGSIVEKIIIDNKDFNDKYPAQENKPKCNNPDQLAYTAVDKPSGEDDGDDSDGDDDDKIEHDGLEKTHFCPDAWNRKDFSKITADCGALDPYPSEKMDTFSRIALHEMTHYSFVGPPNVNGEMIQDLQMSDGETAYGTVNAHALVDEGQDDFFNPAVAETNADNYAWMALDALVSRHCTETPSGDEWQNFFKESPPKIQMD